MTPEKVLEVIGTYRNMLESLKSLKIEKIDFPHDLLVFGQRNQLSHCLGMLDKMEEFIAEGRIEKTMRWLGFIQGVLWANRCYTLEDLKGHNRPPEGEET